MARDRSNKPGGDHDTHVGPQPVGEDDSQDGERRRRKTFLPTPAQRERRNAAPPLPPPPPPGPPREPTVGQVLDTVRATIGEPEQDYTSVDLNPLEHELDDPTQPNAIRRTSSGAINHDTQPSGTPVDAAGARASKRLDETDIGLGATQRVPKRNAIAALRASLRTTGLDSQPAPTPAPPGSQGDWSDTQVSAPLPTRPREPEEADTSRDAVPSRRRTTGALPAASSRHPSGSMPASPRQRRPTAGYEAPAEHPEPEERDTAQLPPEVRARIEALPDNASPTATLIGHSPHAPLQQETSTTLAPQRPAPQRPAPPAPRRSKRAATAELGAAAADARGRAKARAAAEARKKIREAPAAAPQPRRRAEPEEAPTRAVVRQRRASAPIMPTPPPQSGGPEASPDDTAASVPSAPPTASVSAGATDGASAGAGAGAGAADQSTIARHLSDFRRDPADSTAFNALRRAYQGQSRDPELAALYERRADHLAEGHGAADLLWRAAEIHHARGNAESELRVLNKAVARDKGHQRALERLKGLAQATERWTELVRLLELEIEGLAEAGRDTRRAARLEFELGQLWEQRLGRMDRAIACYQRAFAGDATHAEAIEAGRRIYAQVGHFETVAQLYRVELETITDTRTKIDRLLALGQLYRDKLGDMESAARCYTEALQLRPGNEELMETLGEIYASPEWPSPGGLDKAASIYMQIAQRRQSRGDRDGAIGYLRRALGADPENEAAATRLERAYQETGRWADLDRLYRQRISVASDLEATQLLMRRAELLERKLGDRQGARECYETVLPREVLGGPASTRLKELYRADEDWEKLEQLLQRELDGAKDRNARLKLMMEIALIRRDHGVDSEGAAVLLHEILQIDPEHRKALAAYEDYFRQKGDYRNLSELLRYAAQSAREANAPPMEICARLEELADVCERRLGDLEGAAEAWQQIADLHPDTGRSKESLRRIGVRMRMWQQRKAAMEHELSQAFGASERLDVLRRCAKAYHDQMLDPLDLAEILREILTQSPGDESALRMLVEIYEREADHEGVAWALSHQLDGILTKVERARVLKRLAEVYAEQLDRPTDAIAAYQELAELTPTDRAAVTKLQQLLDQADDLEELARVLGRRVEAARSADERLKALKELAKLMDDRLEAPARAIECWEDVRALMPHDEEALAALTRLTEDTGDYVKLLSILRQRFDAALEDPDAPPAPAGVTMTNPGALTPAARAGLLKKIAHVAEQKLSRPDEAAAAYEELAELLPASREALEALERLYSQLGYHERLASVLSRQLDLADDAEERVVLAFKQVDVLEGQLGDIDRAAEAFERILDELAPADLDAHRRLKQLHLRRNDFARAAEIAERELFLVPDSDDRRRDRLELALEIADLWWRRAQDAQRAQLAYERVLSIDNENAEALRELRRIYHRTESYEELVRRASAIFAAIESDRERQVLLLELAQVCEDRLQDPTRAFEWYRRANDLYPDDGTALQHLRRLASEHEMWHELLAVYRESLRRVIGSAEHMALIFEMSRIADEHLGDQHAAFEILISGLEVDPRGEQLLEPMTRVAEQSGQQRALYDVYHHLLEREDEPVRRDRLLAQRAQIADEALRDPVRALADEVRRYELGVCDEAALVERIEALARRARSWGPVLAVHRVRYERAEDDELRLSILEHVAGLFEENLGDKRRAFEVWLQAFGVRKDEHTVGQCWRLAGELSGRAGEGEADAELEVDADDIVDAKEASHPEADPAAGEAWDGPTVAMRQPAHEAPLVIEPTKKRRDDTIELSLSDAAMMVAVAPAVGRRKSADESDINIESSKKRRDKTIELSLTDAALLVGGAPRKPRKDETMELDGSDILELAAQVMAPPPRAPGGGAPPPLPPPIPGGPPPRVPSRPSAAADVGSSRRVASGENAWQALERAYRAHVEAGVDSAVAILVEVAGMWSRGAGDVERAFDVLAEAALLLPAGEVIERELLALAEEHDRFERVIEIYRDLIDHAADAAALMQLHLRLGQLIAEHGNLEDAEPHLAAVLAIDPREPRAAAALDALYDKLERFGDLAQLLSRQLELLGTDLDIEERAERLTRLANLYEHQLDRPYDAAEALTRLLDDDPTDADSLARLADIYERLAIWPKHIESVDALIQLCTEPEVRAAHALRVARAYHRELELPDRAIEAYERVLEHDPTSAEALGALEGLYRDHEQIEQLAGVLRAQVDLSADDGAKRAALVRLARALEGLGDPEAAAVELRRARELGDFDPDVEEGLARVLVLAGKADEATALLEEQITRAEEEGRSAHDIAAIEVRLARLRRDPLGDPEGARATLEAALARAPAQREALTELGGMEAAAGNWDRFAELQADLASQLEDDEAVQMLVGAAHACASAGALPAATSLYEGAHSLRPDEVSIIDALLSMAGASSTSERSSDEILARREMLLGRKRPLVEDGGAKAALLTELADIRRQRGATRQEVARLLESALSAEADFVPALDALSSLHLEHDDMDAARDVLEQAIGRLENTDAGRDAGQLYYRLGDIFERSGRSEEGYKYLMQALRLQPRNLLLRLAVGQNRYRAHRWREALRHLEQAGEHDEAAQHAEASAEALYCAGICERRLRRPERSVPLFERALALAPDHVGALKELASHSLDEGEIEEAAARLRRVARVSVDRKERVELLSHLADLYHDQLDDESAAADCYESLVAALLGETDEDEELEDEAAALDTLPRALPVLRAEQRHGAAARAAERLAKIFEGRERRDQLLVAALEHDAAATELSAEDEAAAGRHFEAADRCRRGALDIDPTASEAALGLARSFEARGEHVEVVKLLDAHVKKLPPPRDDDASLRRAQVYELLARAHEAIGSVGRAIEALERRLKLAEDTATRVRLAELYNAEPGRDEAALANHRVLARDLSRTDSLRALSHAAREASAPYRAYCIDRVLEALGELDEQASAQLEQQRPAALPPHAPYGGEISDADREGLLTGDDLKLMGEVFATLWGAAPTLLPKDLESHGVTSKDRVSPAGKEPLALVYSAAARALGIKSTAVYVGEGDPLDPVRVIAMAPPAVIVPRGVAEHCSVDELRFRVGRALELTQPAYVMAEGMPRERFAEILRLVLHAFHPRYLRKRPRPTEREMALREEAQQFRRALPYKIARSLGELLRERADASFDSGAWRKAVDHAATRVGLILSGDLAVALDWVRRREPELAELEPRAQVASSEAVSDLLTFAASDSYYICRVKLGLGGNG